MSNSLLRIRLVGRTNSIPASSFANVLARVADGLSAIDSDMPAERRVGGWNIVDVHHANPFVLGLEGATTADAAASREVIDLFLRGLAALDNNTDHVPDMFNEDALVAAKALVSVLDDGVAQLVLATEWGGPVAPSQRVAATVDALLPKEHQELGTVQGAIETLRKHTGYSFTIWDIVTGAAVECRTDADQHKTAQAAYGRRVRVFGRITYGVDTNPRSIEVEQIEVLPDVADLPKMNDMPPIDIRSGLSTDEHARLWWYGEEENSVG